MVILSVCVTVITCVGGKKKLGNMLRVEENVKRMKIRRIIKELLNGSRACYAKLSTTEILLKLRSWLSYLLLLDFSLPVSTGSKLISS